MITKEKCDGCGRMTDSEELVPLDRVFSPTGLTGDFCSDCIREFLKRIGE